MIDALRRDVDAAPATRSSTQGGVDRERAAEEGAKAAAHLLTMVIRSLDYAPAVELEFEDVLDAVLVADEVSRPTTQHDYRGALRDSFARYGIDQPEPGASVDLAQMAVPFRYDQINATALRSSKQEAYRFIWQNLAALELKPDWHLQVESLRPALRVGPDGLVVQEVVCDYVQMLELTAGQARELAAELTERAANRLTIPTRTRWPTRCSCSSGAAGR